MNRSKLISHLTATINNLTNQIDLGWYGKEILVEIVQTRIEAYKDLLEMIADGEFD